ncbi:MAG: HD domain-containing protein [Pseudomonadota bacterium]
MNAIEQKMQKWLSPVSEPLPDLYLVGGAVRDYLLNREIMDIDIACKKPKETASLLGQYHDAAVVLFDKKKNAECYRVVDRNNKKNFLDIVPLRKNSIFEDLLERDFTLNSIAIPIGRDGRMKEMIDPLHGAEDIQSRQIRMSSINAFQSDPLRILRAFRFAAELDFNLETGTATMLQNHIHLVSKVSIERIMSELVKLFKTDCSAQYVRRMDKMGLLEMIFPEIQKLKGCGQNDYHHLDVWDHSLLVLENCEKIMSNLHNVFPESAALVQKHLEMNNHFALTKLAALLHDIGKPDTRKADKQSNRIIFHGHDRTGRNIISDLSKRVKLSAKERIFLETMVDNHMHFLFLSRPDVKEKTIFKWLHKIGDDSVSLIMIAMADCKSTLGPASDKTTLDRHLAWSKNFMKQYFYEIRYQLAQVSLINGKDLLALGMSPGPELGRILTAVREAQDLGTIQSYDEGLALAKKMIQNRQSL